MGFTYQGSKESIPWIDPASQSKPLINPKAESTNAEKFIPLLLSDKQREHCHQVSHNCLIGSKITQIC